MYKMLTSAVLLATHGFVMADQSVTTIDQAMYFQSHVADAATCRDAATVKKGEVVFKNISNPAMTCPDAFAWKQFLEAVKSEFWSEWASDQQIWVEKPKAYCQDKNASDCCELNEKTGAVKYRGNASPNAQYCPQFPGAYGGIKLTEFPDQNTLSPHMANQSLRLDIDVSRIARDTEAEIVYHNKPFFNYSVSHDLYHTNGLADVFAGQQFQGASQAPYRPLGQGASYPEDAVMFKVDFIEESVMKQLGYISDHDNDPKTPMNNTEYPYITMEIQSPDDGKTKTHYLVAVTGASKALPNWHWYAFEHVHNIGRCDYLGCNDSFGFKHKVTVNRIDGTEGVIESHYISPHQVTTGLQDNVFVRNKKYASATMTPQLKALFKKMKVGQGKLSHVNKKQPMPKVSSSAWQSYRLKGTQVSFYNNDGSPVKLGASVTEGGFVNTASCMSCHVQAGVGAQGTNVGPVGGTLNLSLDGIPQVTNGAPERSVFFQPGSTTVNTVPIDFVWGTLNAHPLSED